MDKIETTIDAIERVDFLLAEEAQKRLDNLTKPQGSLGRLEDFVLKYCLCRKKEGINI